MRALTILIAPTMPMSRSTEGRQLPRDGIPPVLASAVRRIQPPEGPGNGALTLFKPGATASAPPDILRSLGQYIQTTTPSQWTVGSRLSICSDCFVTLIVLTLRESEGLLQTHTAFWDLTTKGRVPAEVLRIHDLALALQQQ